MNKRVLVLEEMSTMYSSWIKSLGYELADSFSDLAFILFTGGPDINPTLYGEIKHPSVLFIDEKRDEIEVEVFERALSNKIPMVGICRGAQMLCVLHEEKLIQNVCGHRNGTHKVTLTENGKSFFVTSTHHQMMSPKTKGKILAYSNPISHLYSYNIKKSVSSIGKYEPEAIRWDHSKSLAIQWHPERMSPVSEGNKIVNHWIEGLIL